MHYNLNFHPGLPTLKESMNFFASVKDSCLKLTIDMTIMLDLSSEGKAINLGRKLLNRLFFFQREGGIRAVNIH